MGAAACGGGRFGGPGGSGADTLRKVAFRRRAAARHVAGRYGRPGVNWIRAGHIYSVGVFPQAYAGHYRVPQVAPSVTTIHT